MTLEEYLNLNREMSPVGKRGLDVSWLNSKLNGRGHVLILVRSVARFRPLDSLHRVMCQTFRPVCLRVQFHQPGHRERT